MKKNLFLSLLLLGILGILNAQTFLTNPVATALNPALFNGGNIVITGVFSVNKNFQITNCNLQMNAGATIQVQPGVQLTITNSHIDAYSSQLWNGIAVGTVSNPNSATTLIVNSSWFAHARAAIQPVHKSNFTINGGYFYDNFVGIYVAPRTSTSQPLHDIRGTISRSVFVGTHIGSAYTTGWQNIQVDMAIGTGAFASVSLPAAPNNHSFAGIIANDCLPINWLSLQGKPFDAANITLFTDLHVGACLARGGEISLARFENINPISGYSAIQSSAILARRNQSQPLSGSKPYHLIVRGFGKQTNSIPLIKNCQRGIDLCYHTLDLQNSYLQNISEMAILIDHALRDNGKSNLIINNYFDLYSNVNLGYAISIYGSDRLLDIQENTFELRHTPATSLAANVAGISVSTFSQPQPITIRRNTMNLRYRGTAITLSSLTGIVNPDDSYSIRVARNNINIFAEDYTAIVLSGFGLPLNSFIELQHNTIVGKGTAVLANSAAILLDASTNINVTCNSTDKTPIGIAIRNNCYPSVIQGNDFYRHSRAIRFSSNGVIGVQNNTGNQWLGTSGMAVEHTGGVSASWVSGSKFIVNNLLSAPYWPTIPFTVVPTTGFSMVHNGTSTAPLIDCSSQATGANLRPLAISALDQAVATGQYEAPEYTEENLWQMQRDLYQWLIANDSLWMGDSMMTAFVNAVENEPLGQMAAIGEDLPVFVSPTVRDQHEAALNLLLAKEHEIWLMDSLIAVGPDDTLEIQNRAALVLQYEQLTHFADSLGTIIQEGNEAEADTLRARLDRINATEVYEQNEVTVNSIYLSTLAVDEPLTTDQEQQLEAIAAQCPMAGGRAVLHARAILARPGVERPEYDDAATCLAQGMIWRPGKQVEEGTATVSVTPNPANEVLTISNTTEAGVLFSLYDVSGKLLLNQPVGAGETATLSLEELALGVYPYTAGEHSGKLVIVR